MEFITGTWGWLSSHIPQLLQIVGAAAIVATMTPNKTDDKIVQMILDAINFLGGNLGKAKNDPAK